MPWTEAMDRELKDLIGMKLSSVQIANKMGLSKNSVVNRARRTGVKFYRSSYRLKIDTTGHRPFTARCREILREHGVML